MSAPLVSVVMLTSNRETLLREAVDAVFGQDYAPLELILVDNMSTDSTQAYAATLPADRVTYLRHPNGGILSVNRNLAIGRARGKYIAFCDDDDVWMPGKLRRQVEALEALPDAGVCFTDGLAFREGVTVAPALVTGKKRWLRRSFAGLLMENCLPSSSVVVRRSALEQAGLFDEAPELVAVEDWELWLRLAHRHPPLFVPEPLVRIRLHQNLSAKPSVTVLRNMTAIRAVARKLGVGVLLRDTALAYQWLKHGWFRLRGR